MKMNANQKVFAAVTGFEASDEAMGAAQDYDETNLKEIEQVVEETIDNADYLGLEGAEDADVEKVSQAIYEFHACNSGCGVDLDTIFSSL